jgi:hypothetical protein
MNKLNLLTQRFTNCVVTEFDRIDNNGNYEPNNVRWSNPIEQKANQRNRRWHKKPA